jgi:AcrR family transcriptional regulator
MDAIALRHPVMRGAATRDALLDAAESLIADHGYRAPSHRMIAAEAGAHVALVNYHFGSKEMLFEAAVERRSRRLVDAWQGALADARENPKHSTEDVLRAWWRPFDAMEDGEEPAWRNYLCVIARLSSAPQGNDWYQRYFGTVDRDFQRALGNTLAVHDSELTDVTFRYARALFGEVLLHRCGKSGGECVPRGFRPHDTERMIAFVAAGMRGVGSDGHGPNEVARQSPRPQGPIDDGDRQT